MLSELKLLANLEKLGLKWKGRFDHKPAQIESFDLRPEGGLANLTVDVTFMADGATHTIQGTYEIKGGKPDVIKFDGQDVQDDDVDFDVIFKITHLRVQYEFRFADAAGADHEFTAFAKVKLPLPL